MHSPRTIVAFLIGAGFLSFMVGLLNHYFAQIPSFFLYFIFSGLFVSYAAFYLGHRTGLTSVFLLGLFLDVGSGLPFGSQAFLFGIMQTVLFRFRERIVFHEKHTRMITVSVVNLVISLVLVVMRVLSGGSPVSVVDLFSLVASQLILIPLIDWYFYLQNLLRHFIAPPKEDVHIQRAK